MHLFGIITKQDGGVTENERTYVEKFLIQQISFDLVQEYLELYEKHADWGKDKTVPGSFDEFQQKYYVNTLGFHLCTKEEELENQEGRLIEKTSIKPNKEFEELKDKAIAHLDKKAQQKQFPPRKVGPGMPTPNLDRVREMASAAKSRKTDTT